MHFIAKPDDGVCGKNIMMLHSIGDIDLLQEGVQYACQYYVNNPLLFGNSERKIDFRVTMLQIKKEGKE